MEQRTYLVLAKVFFSSLHSHQLAIRVVDVHFQAFNYKYKLSYFCGESYCILYGGGGGALPP